MKRASPILNNDPTLPRCREAGAQAFAAGVRRADNPFVRLLKVPAVSGLPFEVWAIRSAAWERGWDGAFEERRASSGLPVSDG